MKISEDEQTGIKTSFNDLRQKIELVRSAPITVKAGRADKALDSALVLFEKIIKGMGVNCDN